MNVSITYCVRWSYLPRASSLGARLARELGIEARLIKGDNGVFDVVANGKLIFSKDAAGRFPEESEIVEALRSLV